MILCELCPDEGTVILEAHFVVSLEGSDSAANVGFVCWTHIASALDAMLSPDGGLVLVQATQHE